MSSSKSSAQNSAMVGAQKRDLPTSMAPKKAACSGCLKDS